MTSAVGTEMAVLAFLNVPPNCRSTLDTPSVSLSLSPGFRKPGHGPFLVSSFLPKADQYCWYPTFKCPTL